MELTELREQIDRVDRQLIALLEERMDVAAEIGAFKRGRGLPVLDAEREAEKLAAVRRQCRPATADGIEQVFVSVMAASRDYQTALGEGQNGG